MTEQVDLISLGLGARLRIAREAQGIELQSAALARAEELSRLGANREIYGRMKERIYGENSAINNSHGPAYMLKNSADFH